MICSGDRFRSNQCNEAEPPGMAKPRGSLPKVNSTRLSARMPNATVAISQAFEPLRAKGRTAMRSTSTPYSAHSSKAVSSAGSNGQPRRTEKV